MEMELQNLTAHVKCLKNLDFNFNDGFSGLESRSPPLERNLRRKLSFLI